MVDNECFFRRAKYFSDFNNQLLLLLRQQLESSEFKNKHRLVEKAFIRNRKLPFSLLVLFLANFLKGSLQDELDGFFQSFFQWDVSRRHVTRSALCQARKKLSHTVFIALLDLVCCFLDKHPRLKTFHGLRVFAIDGSTLRLPDNPENRERFGQIRHHKDQVRAMARLSILHDPLNRVTYDAILGPYSEGETTLAWNHLDELDWENRSRSLFVMDRGYASFQLLNEILDRGHHFCVRIKANSRLVKELNKSEVTQIVTKLRPSSQLKAQFRSSLEALPVRVLTYHPGGKEPIYLATSLLKESEVSLADLAWLYHQRWQIEESYRIKKCRLQIEEFSSESGELVLQDFHAKIFAEALTSALSVDLEDAITDYSQGKKYRYQLSLTQALAKMKNTIVLLFTRECFEPLLEAVAEIFMKSLDAKVPDRKVPRKPGELTGIKQQGHAHAYRRNR